MATNLSDGGTDVVYRLQPIVLRRKTSVGGRLKSVVRRVGLVASAVSRRRIRPVV